MRLPLYQILFIVFAVSLSFHFALLTTTPNEQQQQQQRHHHHQSNAYDDNKQENFAAEIFKSKHNELLGRNYYQQAKDLLDGLNESPVPVFQKEAENLIKEKYISVSDITVNIPIDYYEELAKEQQHRKAKLSETKKEILRLLKAAAKHNHVESAFLLGEFYLYGNYSFPKDARSSLKYYKKVTRISDNSTANFMVGFIYSTGLFGRIPVDQARANIYYKAAADLGDPRGLMTLGYRYMLGIAVEKDCNLALFYYSSAAKLVYKNHLQPTIYIGGPHLEQFSVRIYDFGKHSSVLATSKSIYNHGYNMENDNGAFELPNSIRRSVSRLSSLNIFSDLNGDDFGYIFAEKYDEAMRYYDGDYIHKRDYDKAFKAALDCANSGIEYESEIFSIPDKNSKQSKPQLKRKSIYTYFIHQCIALVGHSYLRGEGVEQNFQKAEEWLSRTAGLGHTSTEYNDLGLMYEFGLVNGTRDFVEAQQAYWMSASLGNENARFNVARLVMAREDPEQYREYLPKDAVSDSEFRSIKAKLREKTKLQIDEPILTFLEKTTYIGEGQPAIYYEIGRLLEFSSELPSRCSEAVAAYKTFIEKFENYISSLEGSLKSLLMEDYDNALIGYAMAAEQGYEMAQASAAYLLYQPPSIGGQVITRPAARFYAAGNYLTKAAKQSNIDALVQLGDLYYHALLNESLLEYKDLILYNGLRGQSFEKASTCYQVASNKQHSQASWNLGYMYENGIGVERDFHLAKRYYDLALVNHPKSFLAVKLSLTYLAAKVWVFQIMGWEVAADSIAEEEPVSKRTWADWWNMLLSIRTFGNDNELANTIGRDSIGIQQPQHIGADAGHGAGAGAGPDLNSAHWDLADLVDYELTYEEMVVLFGFALVFVVAYGSQIYMRYVRRRELERRRANGEEVPDEPLAGQGLFVVVGR